MSLTPTDLKKGVVFFLDGQLYESLEYKQKVQARQQSSVTVRIRNLKTDKLSTHTFRGGEELAPADLNKRTVQFLYADGGACHFMDPDSFEQHELGLAAVGDKTAYLAEGQKVVLLLLDGRPLTVGLPKNVWLEVAEAEAAVKGDTSSAVLKDVKLSTGLVIKVPAFIKAGDVVSVDTASGAYRERQK
ncbi:elongation factor P [Candidatus Saccharibacteria bacterium]|nr:elongation factor P [Candidatus Saccharibacteria bacterium]